MKLPHLLLTLAALVILAGPAQAQFPASSSAPVFQEVFTGGSDSFDLDYHSITMMPYQSGGSGAAQTRYRYSVCPIRALPVDMEGAEVLPINFSFGQTTTTPISISGLPTMLGIPLTRFSVDAAGEIVLGNSTSTNTLTLQVMSADAFRFSGGCLETRIRYLRPVDGRVVIQFDYSLSDQYDPTFSHPDAMTIVSSTFQAEIFPSGMIRYSYFGVDATRSEVGLASSLAFTSGADVDFSSSILRTPDVIVSENSGSATVAMNLAVNQTSNFGFQYFTTPGTAVATHDYSSVSATGSINTGSKTATFGIPVLNDTLGETPEDLSATIHATGNPDWIFAKPRITILDDEVIPTGSGPRIHLLGSRVFVLPPSSSAITITGFKLLSIDGGTLRNPTDQSLIPVGGTFSLAEGSAGLLPSGLGIKFTVATIQSSGATVSAPVGFDLDGANPSPVFEFISQSIQITEGRVASINVSASQTGSSVSYEIVPVSAQPVLNGNGDYLQTVKPLVFESDLATIEIPILADGLTEGAEEFIVRLVDPSPGSFVGPKSRVRVMISDSNVGIRQPTDQLLPSPVLTGRKIRRILDQANFPGQNLTNAWRLVGEPQWRAANSEAWNVREGLHRVEFNVNATASPLYMAPSNYINQGAFGGNIRELDLSFSDFSGTSPTPTSSPAAGSLQVMLEPAAVAGGTVPVAQRGQWRRVGQTAWRDSGTTETNVPAVSQLIEFKDAIAGYDAPTVRQVKILSNEISTVSSRYQTRPATGADPTPVVEPDLKVSGTTWTHIPITAQTNDFTVSFEFKPSGASINTLVGLSATKATSETALSAILRANVNNFQGYAGQYRADNPLAITVDQWHFVEMRVDLTNNNYQLMITPPTGDRVEILIAGAAFRTPASELRYLSMLSTSGSHSVRSIRVAENLPASSWKIIEFPDQKTAFDIAVAVRFRTGASSSLDFTFGLSDGRSVAPTITLPILNLPTPNDNGASGRFDPLAFRLRVDLVARTYQIRGETDVILASGSLPSGLTKANHLYVSYSSDSFVGDYAIDSTILPPASAAPTGADPIPASNWVHIPIGPQTGRFSLTCDIRTISERVGSGTDFIDSRIGLSETKVTAKDQISVALRAKLSSANLGSWEAHTGGPTVGQFNRLNEVPIVNGRLYHVVFQVDIPSQTYRITVAPDGSSPAVILEAGTFWRASTEIRYITLGSVQGRLAVSNIRGPLPHPLDSPSHFTGQIESPNGFGTGTVVADHAVLTSARLVFDFTKLTFTPGITWRRSDGGYATLPDACEPSNVLLVTTYAAASLAASAGTSNGDELDVAVLAFRPIDIPESDNAPGGGSYSGFLLDSGSSGWTSSSIPKIFPSFPTSSIPIENRGKVHGTSLSSVSFSSVSNGLRSASGIQTPPGSEGAAIFARGSDKIYRPAAVCLGAASGAPRFRTIDATLADAIYQANDYQRQPGFLQALEKGGVYYIPTSLARSAEPNRCHIYSDALPATATWTLERYTMLESTGGQAVSVDPGSYTVTFGPAPSGFSGPNPISLDQYLDAGDKWVLPAVYLPNPVASYSTWLEQNFDTFEADTPAISSASVVSPWSGTTNLTAYAFDFDPNSNTVRNADPIAWKPGYPLVVIDRSTTPPTFKVECLRREDPKLQYFIESSDSLAGPWVTIPSPPTPIETRGGWNHARWTYQPTGQPGRKFIRTRVILNP
jgi:hypothetical protein